MGLLKRLIDWLAKRAETCPECGAPPEEVTVWSDGEMHCQHCGYRTYKDRR